MTYPTPDVPSCTMLGCTRKVAAVGAAHCTPCDRLYTYWRAAESFRQFCRYMPHVIAGYPKHSRPAMTRRYASEIRSGTTALNAMYAALVADYGSAPLAHETNGPVPVASDRPHQLAQAS